MERKRGFSRVKKKQQQIFNEVKQLLSIALDATDLEKAEDLFDTCYDMFNTYHMRDKSSIDSAREKWKINNLVKKISDI